MSITRVKHLKYNVLGNEKTTPLTITFNDDGEVTLTKHGETVTLSLARLFAKLPTFMAVKIVETDDEIYYRAALWGYYIETGFNLTAYPTKLKWFIRGRLPTPVTFTLPLIGRRVKFDKWGVYLTATEEDDPETGRPLDKWFWIDFEDIADYITIDPKNQTITLTLPRQFNIDPLITTDSDIKTVYSPHKCVVEVGGVIYVFYQDSGDQDVYYYYSTDGGSTWTSGGSLISEGSLLRDAFDAVTDGTYVFIHIGTGYSRGYGTLYAYKPNADGTLSSIDSVQTVSVTGSGSAPSTHIALDGDGKIWCVVNHYTSWPEYHNYVGVEVFTFDGAGFTSIGKYYEELSTDDVDTNNIRVAALGNSKALVVYFNNSNDDYTYYWVVETNGTTITKSKSGQVFAGGPNYGYRFALAGDENGHALMVIRRGSKYAEAIEYTESTDAWGSWFAMNSPSTSLYWALTGDYDADTGNYYDFAIPYGSGNQDDLAKIEVAQGSTSPTRTEGWQTLEAEVDYYFQYSVFLNKSTGYIHMAYFDKSDGLRWEKFQYKEISAGPETITLTDAVGFLEGIRGSLGAGLQDNVGMVELKAGSPSQPTADTINLAELLAATRFLTAQVNDTVAVGDVVGLAAYGAFYDTLTIAEVASGSSTASLWNAVELAGSMGLTAAARVLSLLALAESEVGDTTTWGGEEVTLTGVGYSGASLSPQDSITITGEAFGSAVGVVYDTLTLAEVITAVQQITLVTQELLDLIGVSSEEKEVVSSRLNDLVGALEALSAVITSLQVDTVTLAEALTAEAIISVITQALADVITAVDDMVLNAVAVHTAALIINSIPAGSVTAETKTSMLLVSRETDRAVLGVVDSLGLPDVLTETPRAVVLEVIPLIDAVVTHYAAAIAALDEVLNVNAFIAGHATIGVADGITLVDSVITAKWLFTRLVLSLYSRITTVIALRAVVRVLNEHKSAVAAILSCEGEVTTDLELESPVEEEITLEGGGNDD